MDMVHSHLRLETTIKLDFFFFTSICVTHTITYLVDSKTVAVQS